MKNQNKMIILIISIILITLLGGLLLMLLKQDNQTSKPQVCFNNNCFFVELAKTEKEHETGLMFRKSMNENNGMLFIFNNNNEKSFWMKNTFINLDIIFIDEDLQITKISKNNSYCDDNCQIIKGMGKYVLEIDAGMSDEIGIKEGERVRFINF